VTSFESVPFSWIELITAVGAVVNSFLTTWLVFGFKKSVVRAEEHQRKARAVNEALVRKLDLKLTRVEDEERRES